MGMIQFSAQSLKYLDSGKAVEMFNKLIREAVQDCWDRPALDKDRCSTLQVNFRPVKDDHGDLVDVNVIVKAKNKIPDYSTKEYSMQPRANGVLCFNRDSRTAHDQQTFLEDDEVDHEDKD